MNDIVTALAILFALAIIAFITYRLLREERYITRMLKELDDDRDAYFASIDQQRDAQSVSSQEWLPPPHEHFNCRCTSRPEAYTDEGHWSTWRADQLDPDEEN